jgi:hypothetical protein
MGVDTDAVAMVLTMLTMQLIKRAQDAQSNASWALKLWWRIVGRGGSDALFCFLMLCEKMGKREEGG